MHHHHHNHSLHWVSALVFLAIALGHALRVIQGASLIMGGYQVPMEVSIAAAIVFAGLSVWNFSATRCSGHGEHTKEQTPPKL